MNPIRRLIHRPRSSNVPEALAITDDDRDRRLLSECAVSGRWDLRFAGTCAEALATLERGRPVVILCDRDLPGLNWRNFFEQVAASHGDCSLILMSPVYDGYLWNEVVQRGGYDVLAKPLQQEKALSAVNLAWLYARIRK